MPRPKPVFNDHRHYFENVNYIEPDDNYNSNTKVYIKCENNHVYKLSVNEIKNQGKDPTICPHCKNKSKYNKMGIPICEIEEYAINNNVSFCPIKEWYNRWEDSITFISNETGNKQEIKSLAYWEKRKPEFVHKRKILDTDEINKVFDKVISLEEDTINLPISIFNKEITENVNALLEGSTWHIKEYNGTKSKSKFICKKCGYEKYTNVYNLKGKGINCIQCFKNKQKCEVTHKLINICKEYNLILDESFRYKNTQEPIKFICNSCGNVFHKSWADITGLYYCLKCPKCLSNNKNIKENEISEYIENMGFVIEKNNRKLISPLEIDCFVKSKQLAIEFCGNFWHSTKFHKDTNYHLNKFTECKEKNIKLITIFEDEWDDKKDICKSKLSSILGVVTDKIFARKCIIIKCDKEEVNCFLEENHIQGKCNFDKNICLKYNGDIVSVMCFVKHSNRKYDWELVRFCSKKNTVVVGGASKLFKNFISNTSGVIVSFADKRWSSGEIYEKLGFTLDGIIRPRFYYLGPKTNWKRKHRFCYNKKRLKKIYTDFNESHTEEKIAEVNGLYRIYDCGYLRYIYESRSI